MGAGQTVASGLAKGLAFAIEQRKQQQNLMTQYAMQKAQQQAEEESAIRLLNERANRERELSTLENTYKLTEFLIGNNLDRDKFEAYKAFKDRELNIDAQRVAALRREADARIKNLNKGARDARLAALREDTKTALNLFESNQQYLTTNPEMRQMFIRRLANNMDELAKLRGSNAPSLLEEMAKLALEKARREQELIEEAKKNATQKDQQQEGGLLGTAKDFLIDEAKQTIGGLGKISQDINTFVNPINEAIKPLNVIKDPLGSAGALLELPQRIGTAAVGDAFDLGPDAKEGFLDRYSRGQMPSELLPPETPELAKQVFDMIADPVNLAAGFGLLKGIKKYIEFLKPTTRWARDVLQKGLNPGAMKKALQEMDEKTFLRIIDDADLPKKLKAFESYAEATSGEVFNMPGKVLKLLPSPSDAAKRAEALRRAIEKKKEASTIKNLLIDWFDELAGGNFKKRIKDLNIRQDASGNISREDLIKLFGQ